MKPATPQIKAPEAWRTPGHFATSTATDLAPASRTAAALRRSVVARRLKPLFCDLTKARLVESTEMRVSAQFHLNQSAGSPLDVRGGQSLELQPGALAHEPERGASLRQSPSKQRAHQCSALRSRVLPRLQIL